MAKGQPMKQVRSVITSSRGVLLILLVLVLLAGLPAAVWLDLRNLTENTLLRQARDLNSVVTSMRAYYGSNV
jgi:adenylate cyclase